MTTNNSPENPRLQALIPLIGTASGFVAMLLVVVTGAASAMMTML